MSGDYSTIDEATDAISSLDLQAGFNPCEIEIQQTTLGEGNQGKVYLVKKNSQMFALKVTTKTTMSLKSLFRELEWFSPIELDIMSRLNHPNIAKAIELIDPKSCQIQGLGILTDLADGNLTTFMHSIKRETSYNTKKQLFLQLCNGLQYMNDSGFVHGDIKPDNILVQRNKISPRLIKYRLILTDFGLSHVSNSKKTYAYAGKRGTPLFLPLEILNIPRYHALTIDRGIERDLFIKVKDPLSDKMILLYKFGEKSDIWALALTMLKMFSFYPDNEEKEIIPVAIDTQAKLNVFLGENFFNQNKRLELIDSLIDPTGEIFGGPELLPLGSNNLITTFKNVEKTNPELWENYVNHNLLMRNIFNRMLEGRSSDRATFKEIILALKSDPGVDRGEEPEDPDKVPPLNRLDTIREVPHDLGFLKTLLYTMHGHFMKFSIRNHKAKVFLYALDLINDFFLIGMVDGNKSPFEFLRELGGVAQNILDIALICAWRYNPITLGLKGIAPDDQMDLLQNIQEYPFFSFFTNFILVIRGRFGDNKFKSLLEEFPSQSIYNLYMTDPLIKYRAREPPRAGDRLGTAINENVKIEALIPPAFDS